LPHDRYAELLKATLFMNIIPAINETDFKEIKNKINLTKDFGAEWAHIDVADGKFAPNKLWNNPRDLITNYQLPITKPNIEVHLMVENPDEVLGDWIKAGAKRVIAHIEAINFGKSDFHKEVRLPYIEKMKKQCEDAGVELALAINPDTPIEHLFESYESYEMESRKIGSFLILAVNPGLPGQKFQENQLDKIRALRQKMPDVIIMVDGGVNLETAPKIKEAGADILVSASYIWNNKDPEAAYQKLQTI
jgi:ribulose-phosphate 3-epimerase